MCKAVSTTKLKRGVHKHQAEPDCIERESELLDKESSLVM